MGGSGSALRCCPAGGKVVEPGLPGAGLGVRGVRV